MKGKDSHGDRSDRISILDPVALKNTLTIIAEDESKEADHETTIEGIQPTAHSNTRDEMSIDLHESLVDNEEDSINRNNVKS